MGFLEEVQERLKLALPEGYTPEEEAQALEDNIYPNDFILMGDEVVSIYSERVGITDIVDYFKGRMPFFRVSFTEEIVSLAERPIDNLTVKHMVYHQLMDNFLKYLKAFDEALSRKHSLFPEGYETEGSIGLH